MYFGRNERLEISDLLTPAGELLCVKTACSSGTLSHLVAEAVNSSKACPEHQAVLKPVWEDLRGPGAAIDRSNFTFVLAIAIATSEPGPLSESLFFFAKVQIARLSARFWAELSPPTEGARF